MTSDEPPPQPPPKSSLPRSAPTSDPSTPRPLTIDDVPRLGSGTGIAIGCFVVVVIAIVLFWLVRGWLLRAA
jgi:hypothetical protein